MESSSRNNRRRRRRESTSSSASAPSTYGSLSNRSLQHMNVSDQRTAAAVATSISESLLLADITTPSSSDWSRPTLLPGLDTYLPPLRTPLRVPPPTSATIIPRSTRRPYATRSSLLSNTSTMASSSADTNTQVADRLTSTSQSTRQYIPQTTIPATGSRESPHNKRRKTAGRIMGGAVNPQKLKLIIVDPESHGSGSDERDESVHNILKDDRTCFTFPHEYGTPTIIRLRVHSPNPNELVSFCLSSLTIETPREQISTRFREGLVYIAYSLEELKNKTTKYTLLANPPRIPHSDDSDEDEDESDDDEEIWIDDPEELDKPIDSKRTFDAFKTNLQDIRTSLSKLEENRGRRDVSEFYKARAKVLLGRRKRKCEIVFDPELSGVYIELRLYTHHRNDEIKIRQISAMGTTWARTFPSQEFN